jgi:hypothetical protein
LLATDEIEIRELVRADKAPIPGRRRWRWCGRRAG